MTCLNCTLRALRWLIHDPIPPDLSILRHGALRKPLLQKYPTQLRRQSTFVANHDQPKAATDDDYIPFVGIALTDHHNSLTAERLAGQMHRPPPPPPPPLPLPVPPGAEPEIIILKGPEQREVKSVVDMERGGIARTPPADIMGELPRNKPVRKGQKLDHPPKPPHKQERKPRLDALSRKEKNEKKVRRGETGISELIARRPGKWELPPIEDLTPTKFSSRLQRHVATTPHRELEVWRSQKAALEKKFGSQGWNPAKRLSPEALGGIRALYAQHPDQYTTPKLADLFKVSPEVVRRILKSKWRPSPEEAEDRNARWENRGKQIFNKMVQDGTVKTKSMKKKERKARDKRNRWDSVADRPGSLRMSERIF